MDEPRVLLVDDNEEFLNVTAERLALRDLRVETATSGAEAVRMAAERGLDVLVLDLAMPGMDGVQTLRAVKEQQPFLEVIMLTGRGSLEAALESGRCDAFRFLEKPVKIDKLEAVVREACEHKREQQRGAYLAELEHLNASASTPREIMKRTRELRARYEQ